MNRLLRPLWLPVCLLSAALPAWADIRTDTNLAIALKFQIRDQEPVKKGLFTIQNHGTVTLRNADLLAIYAEVNDLTLGKKARFIRRDLFDDEGVLKNSQYLVEDAGEVYAADSLFNFGEAGGQVVKSRYHDQLKTGFYTRTEFVSLQIFVDSANALDLYGLRKVQGKTLRSRQGALVQASSTAYAASGLGSMYSLARKRPYPGLVEGTVKMAGSRSVFIPSEED